MNNASNVRLHNRVNFRLTCEDKSMWMVVLLAFHSVGCISYFTLTYPVDKQLLDLQVAFAPTLEKAPLSCIS